MPFWKKSEDPWDYEPEKPSRPAEPGQEEKDCAPSLNIPTTIFWSMTETCLANRPTLMVSMDLQLITRPTR